MAAAGTGFIRLRLCFDYPPPVAVGCRMCWLLVDVNACRVVADLESTIRERFGFSRGSILSLFIRDCYLPHTESIYVVRDNDDVRVKVERLAQVNGHSSPPEKTREKSRKRPRAPEEDGPGCEDVDLKCKKKKKKKVREEKAAEDAESAAADGGRKTSAPETPTQKKKKKKKTKVEASHAATPNASASPQKTPVRVDPPVKGKKKKPPAAPLKGQSPPSSDSSSSSSSSEEDKVPKKTTPKTSSTTPAAPKTPSSTKPTQKPPRPPSPSSSDTETSSDEAHSVKIPPPTPTEPAVQSPVSKQNPAGSTVDPPDEDDIQLVIRKPQPPSWSLAGRRPWGGRGGPGPGPQGRSETSRTGPGPQGRSETSKTGPGPQGRSETSKTGPGLQGRSETSRTGPGHQGRSETSRTGPGPQGRSETSRTGPVPDGLESSCSRTKEPSYHTDSLSNKSVVLQNGPGTGQKRDYSSMPLLAAPPQVGQKIAFKLLELTENYTPEISEYKEGKIVNFDPTTKQIELELLHTTYAPVEPGKFDLVYQNPDGSERVEYAVTRGSWVTERWESLVEPRLVI